MFCFFGLLRNPLSSFLGFFEKINIILQRVVCPYFILGNANHQNNGLKNKNGNIMLQLMF
jgi:hypothetical protein